jgi:CDP-diacylglycerol--glycerol-3-phosphate 3-phosphatidyltransferase
VGTESTPSGEGADNLPAADAPRDIPTGVRNGVTESLKRPNPMRGRVASIGDTPASSGNVANIVTLIRILLAPVFIVLLVLDNHEYGWLRYAALVLFILAISTDGVDGYLARRRNLVTDVGIILDPIADKILTGSALVVLSVLGELWWWVTVVILVREVGVTLLRFVVLRDRVIPASRGGKVKTTFQAVAISLMLLAPWSFLGEWARVVTYVILGIALVLTIITGIDYLWQAYRKNRPKA